MNLKTVCFLLSLCHATSAAALGLGDLNVRSSLGQPLHATIKILDASAAISVDCFSLAPSVGGIAPPPRTKLSLEQTGDQTLLHLRTTQTVNDPIAQFVLTSDCEVRLQRDYTLLLDPPVAVASPVDDQPLSAPVAAAVPQSTPHLSAPEPRAEKKVAPPPKQRPRTRRAPAASESAPRLLLSGRRVEEKARPAFALKLDTNLSGLGKQPRPDNLNPTELSDENTALSHKLTYLEAQLAALQQRNAELDAQNRAASSAPAAVTPPPENQPAQWPIYLLVIGLLIAAGTMVAWLRSRSRDRNQVIETLGDTWIPDRPTMLAESELTEADPSTRPMPQPTVMPAAPQRMAEIVAPIQAEATEVKDDILDQAEVYMAHGHGELAIHLLQEHLRAAPDESPIPWLLLLDLLHREGNTENYDAACIECRRHFNINLSGHPISQDSEPSHGLEAYPHLLEQLVSVWGTPDSEAFFHDLIYDNRGGTRVGFEPGAYRDILMLRAIAQEMLPLAA